MHIQLLLACSTFILFVLTISLYTAPNRLVTRSDSTVEIFGISQALLDEFKLFANYTAASYCPNNENATFNSPVTCGGSICPLVETDSATIITSFGNASDSSFTDLKGFVALDPVRSLIIVTFAGSGRTIRNWITDFTFLLVPATIPGCGDCWIHSGFATGWSERRTVVLDAVTSALASHGDYKLILTGHSIGGAVATLAAVELRGMGHEADMYTYGTPRIGNGAFATFVTEQAPALGGNFRMTHVNDPVPQLPPTWIGYQHFAPEYWLANGTATTDNYEAEDVVVCEDIGNGDCNAGTGLIPIEGDAHDHYLGNIGACQGGISW